MKQLTENYCIRLTKNQMKTIIKLKQKYKINPSSFIREAIAEKLQKEKIKIKENIQEKMPF
jgi:hypothetical protein